jgi:hypothetical protein
MTNRACSIAYKMTYLIEVKLLMEILSRHLNLKVKHPGVHQNATGERRNEEMREGKSLR